MPESKTTNRERLLRLIDGGREALKEFQQESAPPAEPPAAPKIVPVQQKKAASVPPADAMLLAKWGLALVAIVAALHYGARIAEAVKPDKAKAPAAPAGAPAVSDNEAGIGLRLVGVDSSVPPVALLEDLETGKTYFARLNDRVKDVRVKAIEKNKVTVTSKGRTMELR